MAGFKKTDNGDRVRGDGQKATGKRSAHAAESVGNRLRPEGSPRSNLMPKDDSGFDAAMEQLYQAREEDRAASEKRADATKKRKRKRVLLIIGGVLLLAIIAAAIALFVWKCDIDNKISLFGAYQIEDVERLTGSLTKPTSLDDPYYILILGSDSRDETDSSEGRADTQILARVDPVAKKVSLLSIPRDTKVTLPGYGAELLGGGEQKINAAIQYGGPAGAVDAVKALCDVEIAHYVEINFTGLISLVDKLGGVTVNVPVDISYKDEYLAAGEQVLNGQQALLMSRSRNFLDGDYTRMKHQRILIQAIAKKILASELTAIPGLVTDLASCVKTDPGLKSDSLVGLAIGFHGMDTSTDLYMATVPSETWNDGVTSWVVVKEAEFATLREKYKAGLPME